MADAPKPKFVITQELLDSVVFDAPELRDPVKYPANAAEFLASPYAKNDKGFLLSRVEDKADGRGYDITVEASMPYALNDEQLRFDIYKNSGVLLPSRGNIMDKQIAPETIASFPEHDVPKFFTTATGVALHDAAGNPVVTDNSLGKKGSEGNTNFVASGLLTSNFFPTEADIAKAKADPAAEINLGTVAEETIEEPSAVRLVGEGTDNEYVIAYWFSPPPELPSSPEGNEAYQKKIQDKKEKVMRHQLELRDSSLATKEWTWCEMPTRLVKSSATVPVTLNILGQVTDIEALVTKDTVKNSLNAHFEVGSNASADCQYLVTEFFPGDDETEIRNSYATTYEALARTHLAAPKADLPNGIHAALPGLKDVIRNKLGIQRALELMEAGQELTAANQNNPPARGAAPAFGS